MKNTNHTANQGKRRYEAPRAEVIILDGNTALLSVSGSDEYSDIHWGGGGSGEDGD